MKKVVVVLAILLLACPINAYAEKGCCSHHDGQAYCDTKVGKWKCNDGTYSPTCTCQKIVKEKKVKKTTEKKKTFWDVFLDIFEIFLSFIFK